MDVVRLLGTLHPHQCCCNQILAETTKMLHRLGTGGNVSLMTEPTKKRKGRRPTTLLGRQLMQQANEKMAAEEARIAAAQVEEARARLNTKEEIERQFDPTGAAVHRGLIRSIVGSLASEGVSPIIDVAEGAYMVAWTDFKRIHVRYRHHNDPRLLAATLRGLMYHEGGHIRWTVPFPNLQAEMNADPAMTGVAVRRLQRAWNALEDQRMETAVVSDSPRKAAFLTPTVMTELLKSPEYAAANYPLLIWRRYIPQYLRDGSRAMFVANQSEALAQSFEAVVDQYVKATTTAVMWDAVVKYADLMEKCKTEPHLPDAAENHSKQTPQNDVTDRLEIPIDPTMDNSPAQSEPAESKDAGTEEGDDGAMAAAGKGEEEKGGEETAGAGEGEGEGEGEGDPSDGDGGGTGEKSGKGAGKRQDTESPHGLTQDDLDSAIEDAEQDRYNDRALDADVDAYHDVLEQDGSKLRQYDLVASSLTDEAAEAENLAEEMTQAFNMATMDRQPAWTSEQRTGILDVGRFTHRQPGDMEYFKRWEDDDQPGYNLAVSVLLDYSGSMAGHLTPLAQVGYACKLACQSLEIPCTVVLWDDYARTLFDGLEEATFMPAISSGGNTDPSMALADLENHRHGRERHLVLIMTDGSWSFAGRTLAPYAQESMLLGIGYSDKQRDAEDHASSLRRYGCHEAHAVTELLDIPRHLEDLLIKMA